MATAFLRHFGEAGRFRLPDAPSIVEAAVDVDLDLERGVTAHAGGVAVEIDGILDRRVSTEDDLVLGGAAYRLRNAYLPCRSGRVRIDGGPVPGVPDISDDQPVWSSAFVAVAETWVRPG